jgi:hypothetical protein
VGVVALLTGFAVVVLLYLLMWLFPNSWGGPNIGAGLLLLGGYIDMAIGLVLLLESRRPRLRERGTRTRRRGR